MAKYVFIDFRESSKTGSRLLFFNQVLKLVMSYAAILLMLFFISMDPVLWSGFPVLFYAKRYNLSESFWAYSYNIVYTFGLFWITPYAITPASKKG
ncbi:hyaluronan synthase [Salegentibacter flavus]|uniref:Hyaluronan synthase n=1 Tax=Salegentibacter flavus TaxID=287099 RepID=A0A1I5CB07_9FLAO|nr:hyaluronan synthase [Salegentibacter flavus]